MKQRYFSMVILLALCFNVTAENRSEQEILNIAAKQLNANRETERDPLKSAKSLQIIIDREELSVVAMSGTRFVVVAKDKAVDPVLGYSSASIVTDDSLSMPDGFRWWLEETAVALNAGAATATNVPEGLKENVEPLLKTKWSQGYPYNKYCPTDVNTTNGMAGRSMAGCVATAMAQILYYYKGFNHGVGTHGYSYTHNGYDEETKKVIKVTDYMEFDFENATFDWDNMLESYEYRLDIFPNDTVEVTNFTEEQANAIATLMRACGVAADMQYGYSSSSSNLTKSNAGLSRNFGYKYSSYLLQSSVNKDTWNKKVYGNLSNGRPLMYAGAPTYIESGHAFVLDGYDTDGLVHVNWGWNGSFDGYYNMWNLYISNGWVNDYSKRHEMICDIYSPDAQPKVRTVHVAKAGTLPLLLPQEEWSALEALKLTGELNGADFEVLRMLCGRDINDNPTPYSLMHLDFSDADIVDGDEPYRVITIGGTTTTTYKYYTYDDRFPAYAFSQCTGLEGITLPRNITKIEDGDASGYASSSNRGAFSQCTGLKEIVIPDGVTWIGNSAFCGCSSLRKVELPNSVTTIGNGTFYGCVALSDIQMPERLTTIGKSCFYGCAALKGIILPQKLTYLGGSAFNYCSSLTEIIIPDGITEIAAFNYCTALKSVSLPSSLTSLGGFRDCSSLTDITISKGVTDIEEGAFSGCASLKEITLPEGLTEIKRETFSGCASLTQIQIPDKVKTIREVAFRGCSSLRDIKIGSGLETIETWSFLECPSLNRLSVDEQNKTFDSRDNCNAMIRTAANQLVLATASTVIPETVTSIVSSMASVTQGAFANLPIESMHIPGSVSVIPGGCFSGCKLLKRVTMGEGVSEIVAGAFLDCVSLQDVQLSQTLQLIGPNAFKGCKALYSIQIPDGVKMIGDYAFTGCTSLSNVSGCKFLESLGEYAFYQCESLASVEGCDSMKTIGQCAFADCKNLVSIHPGDELSAIGQSAFSACEKLPSINLGKKLTVIENGVFKGCASMYEMVIPPTVQKIGDYSFYGCSAMESVQIPDTLAHIGAYAFVDCSALKSVRIPDGVKEISYMTFIRCYMLEEVYGCRKVETISGYAFDGCKALVSIEGCDSVKTIGKDAFFGCGKLVSIHPGDELITIDDGAFGFCKELKTIYLGKKLKSIGKEAFAGCNSFNYLELPATVTSIGENNWWNNKTMVVVSHIENPFKTFAFSASTYQRSDTLYVPVGTKALYEATSNWKYFGQIIEMGTSGIRNIQSDAQKSSDSKSQCYNMQGMPVDYSARKGFYIQGGKKRIVQ